MINLIVATDYKGLMSLNDKVPWHIPEELKFFRTQTLGFPIIMGRKTWESLPKKPLDGRLNFVLSRSTILPLENNYGPYFYRSLEEVLLVTQNYKERFIIGGLEVYYTALIMHIVDQMIISRVNKKIEVKKNDEVKYFCPYFSNWKKNQVIEKKEFTVEFWSKI